MKMNSVQVVFRTLCLCVATTRMFLCAEGLSCYRCLEGEWSPFCNTSTSFTQCQTEEMCFAKVESHNGVMKSHKGCMNKQLCEQEMQINPSMCDVGVVTTACMWCCQHSNCNYDKHPYSASLPATSSPTMQPGTGVTSARSSTCMSYNPQVCSVFIDARTPTSMDQRTSDIIIDGYCRRIPDIFNCMLRNSMSCADDKSWNGGGLFVSLINQLQKVCPRDCNVTSATTCTYDMNTQVTRGIFELDTDVFCQVMQRTVRTTLMCVQMTSSSCEDQKMHTVYSVTVTSVDKFIQLMCGCDGNNPCTSTPHPTTVAPTATVTRTENTTKKTTKSTTRIPTAIPSPMPTLPPECGINVALNCVTSFGELVLKTRSESGDFGYICSTLLPETIDCIRQNTLHCPQDIRKRADMAVMYVQHLVHEECGQPTTESPACDTQAAKECITDLLEVIEKKKDIQEACNLVTNTTQCVIEKSSECSEKDQQLLNRTLSDVLKKLDSKCENFFQCPKEQHIRVVEGGHPVKLGFTFGTDPQSICHQEDCEVFIQITSEHQGYPKSCRVGGAYPQIVFGSTGDGGCRYKITSQNWQEYLQFDVAARIDFRADGNRANLVTLVLTKEKNGKVFETKILCQITVEVIDSDIGAFCKSVGDPHILTFDGLYYDNFLSGVFQLYQHSSLPYEVQVMYTKCGRSASCTCAVAVRSGDSVFVVDYCRRKSWQWKCHGRHHHHHHHHNCDRNLIVKLYKHDEITCGMKIYRKNEKQYYVVLPHGTIVKVVAVNNYLNVYITASPFDKYSTSGLCGLYDGDKRNDLRLRNGVSYHGKITRRRKQPTQFCENWRVPSSEVIFMGVGKNRYTPPQFNICQKDAKSSGQKCSSLLETCDISLGEDITDMLPASMFSHQRTKRDLELQAEFDYELDIIEELEQTKSGNWTIEKSFNYCHDFITARPLYEECQRILGETVMNNTVDMCSEDLMQTEDVIWVMASASDMLEECEQTLLMGQTNTESDIDEVAMMEEMKTLSCPSGCLPYQYCLDGICKCPDNAVCDMPSDHVPTIQLDIEDGLCPQRQTDCKSVVVYGDYFDARGDLVCHFTEVEGYGSDHHALMTEHTVTIKAYYISVNQIICHMPSSGSYYYVSVSNNGKVFSSRKVYYSYDEECYDCHIDVDVVQCVRKPDSCVIDGKCYKDLEPHPEDICQQCNADVSKTNWTQREDLAHCEDQGTAWLIGIIIVVVVVVVVVTILAVICLSKRKRQPENPATAEPVGRPLTSFENQTYRSSIHMTCEDKNQKL